MIHLELSQPPEEGSLFFLRYDENSVRRNTL